MTEEIYTVEETARRLKVSEQTIRLWIRHRQLRAFKVGRNWRITAAEIARILQEGGDTDETTDRP